MHRVELHQQQQQPIRRNRCRRGAAAALSKQARMGSESRDDRIVRHSDGRPAIRRLPVGRPTTRGIATAGGIIGWKVLTKSSRTQAVRARAKNGPTSDLLQQTGNAGHRNPLTSSKNFLDRVQRTHQNWKKNFVPRADSSVTKVRRRFSVLRCAAFDLRKSQVS
jgi:hypothetical protein